MYYEFAITIPANTAAAQKVRYTYLLTTGILTEVGITLPSGCADLARVQVRHEEVQIVPVNRDGSAGGDGLRKICNVYKEIKNGETTVDVWVWNTDECYDHTISIDFTVMEKEDVRPFDRILGIIDVLAKIIAGKNTGQETQNETKEVT